MKVDDIFRLAYTQKGDHTQPSPLSEESNKWEHGYVRHQGGGCWYWRGLEEMGSVLVNSAVNKIFKTKIKMCET